MNTSDMVLSEQPGSFQHALFYLLLLQLILVPLAILAVLLLSISKEGASAVISNVFIPIIFAHLIFVGLALGSKVARKTCSLPTRSAWLVLVYFLLSTVVAVGIIVESAVAMLGIVVLLGVVPALLISLIADIRGREKAEVYVRDEFTQQNERFIIFRRSIYYAVFISAFVAPLWIGLGRAFFGIDGWGVILTVIFMMPIAFAYHFLLVMVVRENKKSRATRLVSLRAATAFAAYLLVVILFEISMVDGGDTSDSINSVITMMSNQVVSRDISTVIAQVCLSLLPITGLIALIAFIVDRKSRTKLPQSNLPPEVAARLAEVKKANETKE